MLTGRGEKNEEEGDGGAVRVWYGRSRRQPWHHKHHPPLPFVPVPEALKRKSGGSKPRTEADTVSNGWTCHISGWWES